MSTNIIYDPQIRINNETFGIVPNTIKLTTGQGESVLKPQSSGNGKVQMVYSEDIETKTAKLMVSVYATKEKIDSIIALKQNRASNYIAINSDELNIILKDATLTNDPEITLGNDGQAELEFSAAPISG